MQQAPAMSTVTATHTGCPAASANSTQAPSRNTPALRWALAAPATSSEPRLSRICSSVTVIVLSIARAATVSGGADVRETTQSGNATVNSPFCTKSTAFSSESMA